MVAIEAIDRSISPSSSTNVTPVETTPSVATCARMLRRFCGARKVVGAAMLKKTTSTSSTISGARSRERRRSQVDEPARQAVVRGGAARPGCAAGATGSFTRTSATPLW